MFQLLPYQIPAADALEKALRSYGAAADLSDLGTGKTYTACEVARRLGVPFGVLAPKAVLPAWRRVAESAGLKPLFVTNYEKMKTGKTGFGRFLGKRFEWNVPENFLLIGDEFHRAKGDSSQNALMMRAAKHLKVLMISGTLATNPMEMRASGYLLGMHEWENWWPWCKRMGCSKNPFGGLYLPLKKRDEVLTALHRQILPNKGYRVRIVDLGDAFPETLITSEAYEMDTKEINAVYREMDAELAKLRAVCDPKALAANELVARLRARQKVELLKVPGLVQMTQDLIAEGQSVVIFTSFHDSLLALCERLKTKCSVHGQQSEKERQKWVDAFQADEERVIVVNIQAGGVGLSLHDLNGNYPRVALICPNDSGVLTKQALGRVHRAGGKSKSIQRFIFAAGTIEEKIAANVQKKLHCIDLLNDADFQASTLNESFDSRSISEAVLNTQSYPCDDPAEPNTNSESTLSTPTTLSSTPGDTASNKESSAPQTASTTSKPVSPDAITSGVQLGKTSDRAHAKHSPSSLKMKAVCPGYRNEESKEPNKYSDRGTRAHEACEKMSSAGLEDDPSLKDAVDKCIGYTRRFIREGSKFLPEQKLKVLDQFGFADLIIINGNVAELIDFKFTHNWYPASGPQFRAYCVGIWDKWPGIERVNVRVPHPFMSRIDEESYTRAEHYEQFVAEIVAIVKAAEREDPTTFRVNSGCTYCARAGKCPALAKLGVEVASRYADQEIVLPEGSLHGSEITDPLAFAKLLPAAQIIEKAAGGWRNAAREIALEQEIPGYQIVHTTGKRRCSNASVAWDVVKQLGVTPEEFAEHAEIGIGALEDLVSSRAPRGQKEQAKQKLEDQLRDRDALEVSQGGFFLKQQKTK